METTKISIKERFAYGLWDLGCNIIYSAMSSFLLFYYTDYVKVSGIDNWNNHADLEII